MSSNLLTILDEPLNDNILDVLSGLGFHEYADLKRRWNSLKKNKEAAGNPA